jgi:hypothetical protein
MESKRTMGWRKGTQFILEKEAAQMETTVPSCENPKLHWRL